MIETIKRWEDVKFNFPTENLKVTSFDFSSSQLEVPAIAISAETDPDVEPDFSIDWNIEYKDDLFTLITEQPPGVKDTSSLKYKYNLTFRSNLEQLQFKEFLNFVSESELGRKVNDYNFSFYASPSVFVERLRLNLKYYFGDTWQIELADDYTENPEEVLFTANKVSIWDMLVQFYNAYGLKWRKIERDGVSTIIVGEAPDEIEHIFEYGKDKGLTAIRRENDLRNIITKLYVRGSERNLPYRYFKGIDPYSPTFPADPDRNDETESATVYYHRLMPWCYRQYVRGWNDATNGVARPSDASDYYNLGYDDKVAGRFWNPTDHIISENVDKWGSRFDSAEYDDIYPTLQGYQKAGFGRLDEVVAVEAVTNDNWRETEIGTSYRTSVDAITATATFRGRTVSSREGFSDQFEVVAGRGVITASVRMEIQGSASTINTSKARYTLRLIDSSNGNTVQTGVAESGRFHLIDIPAGRYYLSVGSNFGDWINYDSTSAEINSVKVTANNISINLPDDGNVGDFKQTFDIWIKDVWGQEGTGSTDYEKILSVWEPIIGQREAKVMFGTGSLAGEDYEFQIAKINDVWQIFLDDSKTIETTDTNGNTIVVRSKYRLSLIKSSAELDATDRMLPNRYQNAIHGDKFYFIDVEMPFDPYVFDAEERLQKAGEYDLSRADDEIPSYAISPNKFFMSEFGEIAKVIPGNKARIANDKLVGGAYLPIHITSVRIAYNEQSLFPTWSVIVSESGLAENVISTIRGELKIVSSNAYASAQSIAENARQMERFYLRKDGIADRSATPTTFEAPITIGDIVQTQNYEEGQFVGAGAAMYTDDSGNGVVEVDRLIVRKDASFNEVTIRQTNFEAGDIVRSSANMTVSDVDRTTGNYILKFASSANVSLSSGTGWGINGSPQFVTFDGFRCMTSDRGDVGVYQAGIFRNGGTYTLSIDIYPTKAGVIRLRPYSQQDAPEGIEITNEMVGRWNRVKKTYVISNNVTTGNSNFEVYPGTSTGCYMKNVMVESHNILDNTGVDATLATPNGWVRNGTTEFGTYEGFQAMNVLGRSAGVWLGGTLAYGETYTVAVDVFPTAAGLHYVTYNGAPDEGIMVTQDMVGKWNRISATHTITTPSGNPGTLTIYGSDAGRCYYKNVTIYGPGIAATGRYTAGTTGGYRCYMDTKNGTILNTFIAGDQAYCQRYDATANTITKYYWRLVEEAGLDYIDLSQEDRDGSGVPAAGDNIVQLGNRTDTSRQGAEIIQVVREGGPRRMLLAGINSYSITGKDYVTEQIDGTVANTWVYGNMYVGDRDGSTYLRHEDGVTSFKGRAEFTSGPAKDQIDNLANEVDGVAQEVAAKATVYTTASRPTGANEGDQWTPPGEGVTYTYISGDWAVTGDDTETVIDGGVITTGSISVGQGGLAGITGENPTASTATRFWAGSTNHNSAPFRVTQAGALTATNANITGEITATSGTFNGRINATGGTFQTDAEDASSRVNIASTSTYSRIAFYGPNMSNMNIQVSNTGAPQITMNSTDRLYNTILYPNRISTASGSNNFMATWGVVGNSPAGRLRLLAQNLPTQSEASVNKEYGLIYVDDNGYLRTFN